MPDRVARELIASRVALGNRGRSSDGTRLDLRRLAATWRALPRCAALRGSSA